MPKFQASDRVKVHGGPDMTVASYDSGTKKYRCTWFDKGKPQAHDFDEAVLVACDPPDDDGPAFSGGIGTSGHRR